VEKGNDTGTFDEEGIDDAAPEAVVFQPPRRVFIGHAVWQSNRDVDVGREPCDAMKDGRLCTEQIPGDAGTVERCGEIGEKLTDGGTHARRDRGANEASGGR